MADSHWIYYWKEADTVEEALKEFQMLRDTIRETQQKSYMRDGDVIGDFSYGTPCIRAWGEGARLIIGKFCSIASGVTIMLGGDHRVDWNSTYPFNALLPETFSSITGHPFSKGMYRLATMCGLLLTQKLCLVSQSQMGALSAQTPWLRKMYQSPIPS